MNRTPRRVLAAAVLVAAATAACGIPADDDPRALSQEGVPEEVRGEDGATSGGQTAVADVYFSSFDGSRDRLVAVERDVPTARGSSTPSPPVVLEALLDGVQRDDAPPDGAPDGPLATKIPDGTALRSAELAGNGVLTVDLNEAISNVTTPGATLAYGQMVCTADELDDVTSVRFTVEGSPVRPPTGDGDATQGTVTCDDYAVLLATTPDA
ncbi:MAG TPA: GerMN domain-containing protein [Acidimicrobiales bacterium]